MAYSEALADPTSRIRFAVQDTDDAAPLLPEATYTALYALYSDSEPRTTVAVAEALLLRYSQEPNKVEVTGAVKVEWTERIAAWRALANGLRADLGLPSVGGGGNTLVMGRFTRATDDTDEYGG